MTRADPRSDHDVPVVGHRVARGCMYGSLAASGVALWFIPIPFLQDLVSVTYLVISCFLLIGGGISAAGHMLRSLVLERAGYPLTIAALVCLTATLLKESDQLSARLFVALLVFAFTLGLYGRWRDLGLLRRVQQEQACNAGEVSDDGDR